MASWAIEHLRPRINSVMDFGEFSVIAVLRDGAPCAVVIYNMYFGHDISMTIASNDPRWASKKVLKGLFAYPFLQMGCARVTATTSKKNTPARNLLSKVGFAYEGKQEKGFMGQYDLLLYGMTKEKCKWLKIE